MEEAGKNSKVSQQSIVLFPERTAPMEGVFDLIPGSWRRPWTSCRVYRLHVGVLTNGWCAVQVVPVRARSDTLEIHWHICDARPPWKRGLRCIYVTRRCETSSSRRDPHFLANVWEKGGHERDCAHASQAFAEGPRSMMFKLSFGGERRCTARLWICRP